jgi:hypothetical protein
MIEYKIIEPYKEVEGIDAKTYAGQAAIAVKTKAKGILGDDLLTFTLIDFVSIMLINNKFLSKGIVITDDTKEEGYIKVIESGDESLINDLEKFINIKDKIKLIESKKEEYETIIKNLQILSNSNDVEKVNAVIESYLRR